MKFKASYPIKKEVKTRSSKKILYYYLFFKGWSSATFTSIINSLSFYSITHYCNPNNKYNRNRCKKTYMCMNTQQKKWLNKKKKRHKVDHWWRWWWDTHNSNNKYNLNYLKYIFQIMKIVRDTIEYTRVCNVHKNVQS